MTDAQASEDVPFMADVEREHVCKTTIQGGKKLFQLDGLLDRLLDKVRAILEARQHDAPPADWVESDSEFERGFRSGRNAGHGGNGSVNSSKALTVLVAINTALLVGIGGWLLVTVERHDTDIAVIKFQLQQAPNVRR
jgi:hypothetical protein